MDTEKLLERNPEVKIIRSKRSGDFMKVLQEKEEFIECDGFTTTGELCCSVLRFYIQNLSRPNLEPYWLNHSEVDILQTG